MKKIVFIIAVVAVIVGVAVLSLLKDTPSTSEQSSVGIEDIDIIGTWQSLDDSKSVVVFNTDSTTKDVYDTEELNAGTWTVFEEEQIDGGDTIKSLRTIIEGEAFDYTILESTKDTLVLSYRTRGNTLRYARIADFIATEPSVAALTDWRDYINSEYQFSLSYPANWEVQESLKPQQLRALHEVMIWEKEYDMWRGSAAVSIFVNEDNLSVADWWSNWMLEEEAKEAECRKEYGDQSPCLFMNGLVESENQTTLAGEEAILVTLFQFDHEEECAYVVHEKYVFGLCSAGTNPNDPLVAEHRAITDSIRDSFKFVL